MFLVGNQQHSLDDKNRIRLPAKFREQLGDKYILMPGMNGCIFVYSQDETNKLLSAIQDLDSLDPDRADWIRRIAEYSATVEADSQGRFMLPTDLIQICEIEKNVQIVGAISKAEIWSEKRWLAHRAEQSTTPQAFDDLYRKLHKAQEQK